MKLNFKSKTMTDLSITDHTSTDKETQRLKWRIYKRRYRQKMRKNASITKHSTGNQEPKNKKKKPKKPCLHVSNKIKEKVSHKIESNFIREPVKRRTTEKEIIPLKVEKNKLRVFNKPRESKNEEINREILRQKWRLYKRNYRQKMRNKISSYKNHSPKIVEEDTAIYFVEDDDKNNEYIYENDFSEANHENEDLYDSCEIVEIKESCDEFLTIKCEPSDFIECVLKPN